MQKWDYNAEVFVQPDNWFSDKINEERFEKSGEKGSELLSIQPISDVDKSAFSTGRG